MNARFGVRMFQNLTRVSKKTCSMKQSFSATSFKSVPMANKVDSSIGFLKTGTAPILSMLTIGFNGINVAPSCFASDESQDDEGNFYYKKR